MNWLNIVFSSDEEPMVLQNVSIISKNIVMKLDRNLYFDGTKVKLKEILKSNVYFKFYIKKWISPPSFPLQNWLWKIIKTQISQQWMNLAIFIKLSQFLNYNICNKTQWWKSIKSEN